MQGISLPNRRRGTRCATAVKPRPSFMSPYSPARPWYAVRGAVHRPIKSASRGTRCATAAKPRPSFMSPYSPAHPWCAVRHAGHLPTKPAPWHPLCHGGKTTAKLHVPLLPCAPMVRSPGCSASPYQIGEPWHPLCHGGKTTAKLHVPLLPCAPMARSPGCRGTAPAYHILAILESLSTCF